MTATAALTVPPEITQALNMSARLFISVSGGKDSQAQTAALVAQLPIHSGNAEALHMDLGRMEIGPESLAQCEIMARQAGLPLTVRRKNIDLLAGFERRMAKLEGTGKPFWPSAAMRWCTSDWKRNVADVRLREFGGIVVSCEGIRAEESPARAKRNPLTVRAQITSVALKDLAPAEALAAYPALAEQYRQAGKKAPRLALTWLPIHDWLLEDVWVACGTSGAEIAERRAEWQAGQEARAVAGATCHPHYCRGSERVSCCFCVMASANDLKVGARHQPDLWRRLVAMERASGTTFKNGWSLARLVEGEPVSANWPTPADVRMSEEHLEWLNAKTESTDTAPAVAEEENQFEC